MKKNLWILLTCCCLSVQAKEIQISFNDRQHIDDGHQLTNGISQKALDLGANSDYRYGVKVKEIDANLTSHSFSTFIWVKSEAKYLGNKALITNKKSYYKEDAGFIISTQENGSWMVAFTDGKNDQWEYKPTVERQPINDGMWHQLGITHDADKQEMRMYYDGKNVAIYCTNGNRNLSSSLPFRLGCTDDGSWNCFNGQLDEFLFTDEVISAVNVHQRFSTLSPQSISENILPGKTTDFKLMAFNIFHGGHELGEEVGVNRVIEIIKESKADVVGMIETYGSGAIIADALGYYFYLRSSNLSIMSKYPIEETYDFYNSFNCSAATLQISQTQRINYLNIWLDYRPSTNDQIRDKVSVDSIIAGEWQTRAKELDAILKDAKGLIDSSQVPLFVSGDFNIDSHLDWCKKAKHLHSGYVIEWPTSRLMEKAGFRDSYREIHPDPVKDPCLTWSTMAKNELQYRIDFIYHKGKSVKVIDSQMIDSHPIRFPSDHAAMLSTFKFK